MNTTISYCTTFVIFFICTLIYSQKSSLDSIQLLKPTGPYAIGTMIYEWTDSSRELQLSNHAGDKRTIIAQLWYPAEVDSISVIAPFSSLSKDYSLVSGNSYLRPRFHSGLDKSNVVLIVPGRGTERFLYSTITEELASHGYVVVAVDMPEIGYTIYKDGMIVKPSKKYSPPRGMMGGPYEKVDAFFEEPTEIGYQDLLFTISQLKQLNQNDSNDRFTSKFNIEKMGIFGHSLGGRIAGKLAKELTSIKGYISMEGIPPRKIRYNGLLNIPVAMLCSSGTWPYARENYFSLIDNRSNPVFMIELPDFGHNSVTDNPYVAPKSFNYTIDPADGLKITRRIVLSYFNDFLRNESPFEEELKNIPKIKVSEFK